MGKRHAVLISSDTVGEGWVEFWCGAVLMHELLVEKHGFDKENVHVLHGDGSNFSNTYYTLSRYQADLSPRPADSGNVLAVLKGLADGSEPGVDPMGPDDLLFVWVHTHGMVDSSNNYHICLNENSCGDTLGDTIDDTTFASYLDQIPHAFRIISLNQCCSGGFVPKLRSTKTVVLTACAGDEEAKCAVGEDEIERGAGPYPYDKWYILGEFTAHLFSALNGETAAHLVVDADADNNSVVTMLEARDYIVGNDDTDETTQYDDGQLDLGKKLHLAFADVFMRDDLLDSGVEPIPGGTLFKSPDICHFKASITDPQTALGASSMKSRDDLFENVDRQATNYLYARLQNRGYSKVGAKVTFFWTRASTRSDPGSWVEIGSVDVPEIEPGDFVVSDGVDWANPPQEDGSYCLISILGNFQDPAPDHLLVDSFVSFHHLVSDNNNVTWKNFDLDEVAPGDSLLWSFVIEGLPDSPPSYFRFDFSQLPDAARAEVSVPTPVAENAVPRGFGPANRGPSSTVFHHQGSGVASLGDLSVGRGRREPVSVRIDVPESSRRGSVDISVSEISAGQRVGGISKRFVFDRRELFCDRLEETYHGYGCVRIQELPRWRFLHAKNAVEARQMGFAECPVCRGRPR